MRSWPWALMVGMMLLASGTARAQDMAAPSESESETASAEAPPARTPKVAIVIVGDPDPSTLAAAHALEATLASDTSFTMPSDEAVRAALRGEGSGDGLDDVRSERRHLGLGEARDITTLTVLGELTSADLVLVVRTSHGATHATAFDVLRRSFYDGDLPLEPIDVVDAQRFVARRAGRAARPLEAGESTTPVPAPPPVVDPATAVPPEAIAPDPAAPHEPDFFEQYWPYFAAGALLIGAVVFIVFATQNNDSPPPVLRFNFGPGT